MLAIAAPHAPIRTGISISLVGSTAKISWSIQLKDMIQSNNIIKNGKR
jgi:hypothetical protein